MTQELQASGVKNVVLVHGAFADGSGWRGVYEELRAHGYAVSVVQNPALSLADDVAITNRVLANQDGPCVLVGHSYGGVVITEAGNDAKVAALVYVAAFAPDAGESVQELIKDPPPGVAAPPILPPQDGVLFLDRTKFAEAFAADVDPQLAAFMADSQVPWGLPALGTPVTTPAWKSKPATYIVATEDRMIPPAGQQLMAGRAGARIVEITGSHAVYVSQAAAVASVIMEAAATA